ncbi:MAG: DUF3592 domain-containing protein [Nocardioides sp.]
MRIETVPTLLLLGTGVVLLGVAALLYMRGLGIQRASRSFAYRAVEVTATVVSLEAKDISLSREPDTRYFPTVRFVPEGATEAVEAQTLTDVPEPPPRVGEELVVAYDPQRPDRVDVAATQADGEGAGKTWLVLARLVLLLALAMPIAWTILALVVWTV